MVLCVCEMGGGGEIYFRGNVWFSTTRWAPESVSTFRISENFPAPAGVRTPDRPACSLFTVVTELHGSNVHDNDQFGHASSRKNQVLVNEENAQTQQKLFV
jgi:hypothetical protein